VRKDRNHSTIRDGRPEDASSRGEAAFSKWVVVSGYRNWLIARGV